MQLELSAVSAEGRGPAGDRSGLARTSDALPSGPPRVLAVHVPNVALQRVQRARRGAAEPGRPRREPPTAVARDGKIVACDPVARNAGVRPGDSVVQAMAACTDLDVVAHDERSDRALLVGLAEALMALSPIVEIAPPDALLLDASGAAVVTRRIGADAEAALGERAIAIADGMGLHARVAVATGRAPARALARHAAGERPTPTGDTRAALAHLPLAALELPSEIADRVTALGLHDVGALAALPAETLAHRFGPAGLRAARLARGDDPSPLVPHVPDALPLEELDLEAPVESAEPLLFGLKRVCDRVAARLAGRGLGTSRLVLRLRLDPRGEVEVPIALASPSAAASRWMLVLRERLATLRLEAPVSRVVLTVGDVAAAPAEQLALDESPQQVAALDTVLARLAARLGDSGGFAAEPVDRHRPEGAYRAVAFRARSSGRAAPTPPATQAALAGHRPTRLLPRPRPLVAEGEGGRLTALRIDGRAYRILDLSAPERLSGEWWSDPYDREYRRVDLERLGACWIFRDAGDGRFWLHGFFD